MVSYLKNSLNCSTNI